ncbi:MAG: hypothetical protein IPM23_26640 [Candidatus Melainabacteria bacterium]|nr:hypothetical protein [Candidatus Melainabacteria bacterium]
MNLSRAYRAATAPVLLALLLSLPMPPGIARDEPSGTPVAAGSAGDVDKSDRSIVEAGGSRDDDVKSIGEIVQDGQIAHEKALIDRFLFGIAIVFLFIATLLFSSLPPKSGEAGES